MPDLGLRTAPHRADCLVELGEWHWERLVSRGADDNVVKNRKASHQVLCAAQ